MHKLNYFFLVFGDLLDMVQIKGLIWRDSVGLASVHSRGKLASKSQNKTKRPKEVK